MSQNWYIPLVCVGLSLLSSAWACGRGSIYLQNNGYKQILIAISEDVPEDSALIDRIKHVFTEASHFLYNVTRNRAFFEDISILIPKSWPDHTNYQRSTTEVFDKSDIVVGPPDPRVTLPDPNTPFVVKTTPCGQLGHYMHLTPSFLLDDNIAKDKGPYGKVIIHEWSHLRYGVFDEYPDGREVPYVYAAQNGEIEGTRCSLQIPGNFHDASTGDTRCNFVNGLPDQNCRFKDQPTIDGSGKYASLLYRQYLNHVSEYCDNDKDNTLTLHNRQAPNKQNTQCDGKSVWEVLREHGDFENARNPPRSVSNTVPKFRLVKSGIRRIVLVLDVSGSMTDNNKIGKLAQAVHNYIRNVIHDNDQLGIVWFASSAKIKMYLDEVTTSSRQGMLSYIPQRANGGTSIGAGLRKGIDVLSRNGADPAGSILILVSDGKERNSPYIDQVKPELIRKRVIVETIAITAIADSELEQLAVDTGGSSFFYSDRDTSNALNEAFVTIGERGRDIREKSVTLSSQAVALENKTSIHDNVPIDGTVGQRTEFVIGYSDREVLVTVTSPSGQVIKKGHSNYEVDSVFKAIKVKISNKAEKGRWKYEVKNTGSRTQHVSITMTSRVALGEVAPIVAQAMWAKRTVSMPREFQSLFVSVSQGYAPILNAEVRAELERPGASSKNVVITLRDNGAGADVTKDDGVYSSFVAKFTDNGRYYVRVLVNDSPTTVVQKDRIVGTNMAATVTSISQNSASQENTQEFKRVTSAGSFELKGFDKDTDQLPPARITDLRVLSVDDHPSVTLGWTASGGDLDQGQASGYKIWLCVDFDTLFTDHTQCVRVTSDLVLKGDINSAKVAGLQETISLAVPEGGDVSFYFAIQAIDDGGNESARSNIVGASMKYLDTTNVGLIVGLVILFTVIIVAAVVGGWFYWKKCRGKSAGTMRSSQTTSPNTGNELQARTNKTNTVAKGVHNISAPSASSAVTSSYSTSYTTSQRTETRSETGIKMRTKISQLRSAFSSSKTTQHNAISESRSNQKSSDRRF